MKDKELGLIDKRRLALRRKIVVLEVAVAFVVAFIVTGAFMVVGSGMLMIAFAFACSFAVAFAFADAFAFVVAVTVTYFFAESDVFIDHLSKPSKYVQNSKAKELKLMISSRYKLLKISELLFSAKTQKEVFEVIMADWDDEIYTALEKNNDASLFMINSRNAYAFLAAMWMKSPIGDLIEFIRKFAK